MPFLFLPASVDLLAAFRDNDWFGKGCIFALSIGSVFIVYIILYKWAELRRIDSQNKRFERILQSDGTWEKLYSESARYRESSLAKLLRETYITCNLEKWFGQPRDMPVENRVEIASATVGSIMSRVLTEEEERLQKSLNWLAAAATIAPFVGLFGTVWGVLSAFQGLGREGAANLTSLAPGVATALFTTLAGLIVAIPAAIFHNKFSSQVSHTVSRMESFASDLDNAVRKRILLDGTGGRRAS